MIRISYSADVEPDGDLIAYLESQREIVYEIGVEVRDELAPLFFDEVNTPAPPVQYPIQWTSDKQRKAFFATDGFGGGIPTVRTGKLEDSWVFDIHRDSDGAFKVVIENTQDYAKYVLGSLAQDRTQALRFQQRFHANTGHIPAHDTVAFYLEAYHELFIEKFNDRLDGFASPKTRKRAFTT